MYKEVSKKLNERYYSNIIQQGGLSNTINLILKKYKSKLKTETDVSKVPFSYAQIKLDNRSSQIMLASKERNFSVDFWCDGIQYGSWWNKNLEENISAIINFIEHKFSCNQMNKKYTWFKSEKGLLHEKEPSFIVESTWKTIINWLKNETKGSLMNKLYEAVKIAYEIDNLKVLMSFTSLNKLCFGLSTGFPFKNISVEIASLPNDKYLVLIEDKKINKEVELNQLKQFLEKNTSFYGKAQHGTAKTL